MGDENAVDALVQQLMTRYPGRAVGWRRRCTSGGNMYSLVVKDPVRAIQHHRALVEHFPKSGMRERALACSVAELSNVKLFLRWRG